MVRWAPVATEYLTDNMEVQTGYDKLVAWKNQYAGWKEHNDLCKKMKMAVDAKGNDLVIVSHVNGRAKEIHIGLGHATWKEAEANNEADKRAAKTAQERAIPEMVVENYKIKAQQTKIMQRMFIDIHKEMRKQY